MTFSNRKPGRINHGQCKKTTISMTSDNRLKPEVLLPPKIWHRARKFQRQPWVFYGGKVEEFVLRRFNNSRQPEMVVETGITYISDNTNCFIRGLQVNEYYYTLFFTIWSYTKHAVCEKAVKHCKKTAQLLIFASLLLFPMSIMSSSSLTRI